MDHRDWKSLTLSQLSEKRISYGIVQTGEAQKNGVKCLRVVDITKPRIQLDQLITTSQEINQSYKRTILEKDELVLALRGEIGKAILVCDELVGCNLTRGLARISPNGNVTPAFLFQVMQSAETLRRLERRTNGSALKEISIGELRRIALRIPPLPEQQKIAAILMSWDRAIELTEELIATKQKRKQSVIQSQITKPLLALSVGSASPGWNLSKLGRFIRKRSEKSSDLKAFPLHSFTIENGVTEKTERYERSFLLKDSDNNKYAIVHFGDFVINPMNLRFGAIGRSRLRSSVSVSAYYDVFSVIGNDCDSSFLEYLLKSPRLMHMYERYATGSLIEKRRVHFSEFVKIPIALPPLREQKRIATILNAMNWEIELLVKKLALLKQQKKGLMQQLLTGKTRVKLPKGAA
ncbi:EcoKI restriction-modification system protein HsdS [Rubripirellula lacrimiformis]|uniref:EcoKI restriction-modification system protein HsdS n=1 Tax=Rubripirellula lacrimiformis TaxID=1930273 RepID=A0A517NDN5_9BACT|nr:restriction endonuclease subunit S [Rubripirellula lacrimiformis]QDT05232.1 EcoKI restriction-modification system protein HsdS [Rubripirellula lacrimiformis]